MGEESCEDGRSLRTFLATILMYAHCGSKKSCECLGTVAFVQNRSVWSERLQTFVARKIGDESSVAGLQPIHAQHPTTGRLSKLPPHTHVLKVVSECDLSSSRISPTKGFEQP